MVLAACVGGVRVRVLRLVLPMPPNVLNARMHWRVKLNAKKEYFSQLDWLQDLGGIPEPPRVPITKARISARMVVGAEHDDDNAMARAYKLPLDWLKTRGYIVDDKRKCVRCDVPEQIVKRGAEYVVELSISEVA